MNNLNVNAENALILQKHELPTYARDFEVTARGRGFSILQLSYKYNLNISGEWPRFVLEPEVHKNSNKEFLHLIVCTSFVPDDLNEKSNMAVRTFIDAQSLNFKIQYILGNGSDIPKWVYLRH